MVSASIRSTMRLRQRRSWNLQRLVSGKVCRTDSLALGGASLGSLRDSETSGKRSYKSLAG
jgi:hypothetical protein